MALKPTLWALDDAPVNDPVAVLVLIGLADEANDEGTGAAPYVDKLMVRARRSKRTVQGKLRDLYRAGVISYGDQSIGMRRYNKPAGKAPRTWDLNMTATWKSLPTPRTDEEVAILFPSDGPKTSTSDDAQILRPTETVDAQDAAPQNDDDAQTAAPHDAQTVAPHGAQPAAPFPLVPRLIPELPPPPPVPPPAAPSPDHPVTTEEEGADPTSGTNPEPVPPATAVLEEILATAGRRRMPGKAVRSRITAALAAALGAGWTSEQLLRQLAGDWSTAENVGAVLEARANDLPSDPPSQAYERRPPRPRDQRCPAHPGQPVPCAPCATAAIDDAIDAAWRAAPPGTSKNQFILAFYAERRAAA